jgi:hypothetical protein
LGPVLQGWAKGDGHVAHGTDEPAVAGSGRSGHQSNDVPTGIQTMLLAVSLLSSIAQSRAGQWMRAAVMLQRRARY